MGHSLFIICAVILTIIVGVNTWHLKYKLHDPELLVTLSTNFERATIGDGFEENHIPVVECASNDTASIRYHCLVHIRSGKTCELSFGNNHTMMNFEAVHQIAENRLILGFTILGAWEPVDSSVKLYRQFLVFNTDTCTHEKLPKSVYLGVRVVPYENGFDLVSESDVLSYDINVTNIGQIESQLLENHYIHDVHRIKGDSGQIKYFMTVANAGKSKRTRKSMVLMDYEKSESKQLIAFRGRKSVVSHSHGSLYATCWNNKNTTTVVQCKQFDYLGNERMSQVLNITDAQKLWDIRNLKAGGVVLFTITKESKLLHITTVLPDRVEETLNYFLPENELMRIADFNEDNSTMNLAYETLSNDAQQAILLQKYIF